MLIDLLQMLVLIGLLVLFGYYWRPSIKFIVTGIVIGKGVTVFISQILDTMVDARIIWPYQELFRNWQLGDLDYYPLIMMCLVFGLFTGVVGSGVEYALSHYKSPRIFRSARSRRASR